MRTLCIQVQPDRAPAIDMARVFALCQSVAANKKLVSRFAAVEGEDNGLYTDLMFETTELQTLWRLLQNVLYKDAKIGSALSKASMTTCEGKDGWNDYLLLYHFDLSLKLDSFNINSKRSRSSLYRLLEKKVIVNIWRKKIDSHPITGYVVGISQDFLLIHYMSDAIILDGYTVVRTQDISLVDDKPKYGEFYTKVLKLRGYKPKMPNGIRLDSIASMLESINEHCPLITVHQEEGSNDCSIGRIEKLTDKTVILKWLTPAAQWEGYSPRYRLTSITKIDFNGLYEDALARVAGIGSKA